MAFQPFACQHSAPGCIGSLPCQAACRAASAIVCPFLVVSTRFFSDSSEVAAGLGQRASECCRTSAFIRLGRGKIYMKRPSFRAGLRLLADVLTAKEIVLELGTLSALSTAGSRQGFCANPKRTTPEPGKRLRRRHRPKDENALSSAPGFLDPFPVHQRTAQLGREAVRQPTSTIINSSRRAYHPCETQQAEWRR